MRVTGSAFRVDARGLTRASFSPGATRNLRVTLVPFRSRLDLDWN